MNEPIILQGITKEELFQHIETVIINQLQSLKDDVVSKAPLKYLNRKESASLLRISLPTLHAWTKKGTINQPELAVGFFIVLT